MRLLNIAPLKHLYYLPRKNDRFLLETCALTVDICARILKRLNIITSTISHSKCICMVSLHIALTREKYSIPSTPLYLAAYMRVYQMLAYILLAAYMRVYQMLAYILLAAYMRVYQMLAYILLAAYMRVYQMLAYILLAAYMRVYQMLAYILLAAYMRVYQMLAYILLAAYMRVYQMLAYILLAAYMRVYQMLAYILLAKLTAVRNENGLSYHKIRGLYFLAFILATTILR